MGKPKYKLETIPVWDALEKDCECFLCDLMKEAETHGVDFYLGSSVMNPETRVKVNEHGFCSHHFNMLSEAQKAQGLALICDTYLAESRNKLNKAFNNLLNTKAGRKCNNDVKFFNLELQKREKGCLICTQMKKRLDRYVYTIIYMCNTDDDFKNALKNSKGVCLHHYNELIQNAVDVLGAKDGEKFIKFFTEIEISNLDRIAEDVLWLTQKYKSENHDKPFNGCEDAHKRTVSKMIGKHRVIDPIDKL
ncbi:MAG: hypothetical protein EOL97_05740 [Spirochaetia bacterium]|nr:hypothetical protein [Spirochaetia bacterium]